MIHGKVTAKIKAVVEMHHGAITGVFIIKAQTVIKKHSQQIAKKQVTIGNKISRIIGNDPKEKTVHGNIQQYSQAK